MAQIAIIGAGPIGIEAAIRCHQLGHTIAVYERGDIAEFVSQWGHVRLFSPFGMNTSALGQEIIKREHPGHALPGAADAVTGNEYRDAYLVPLSLTSVLADRIKTKTQVISVARAGLLKTDAVNDPKRATADFRLLLRDDKGVERVETADYVVDCSGTYGRHAWLGEGGIPALGELASEKMVSYGLEDVLGKKKAIYASKSIIVIGGGYSAATTVCNLAKLAEDNSATWTIWLNRGARSTPLPRNPGDALKERDRLAARANNLATRGDGNVEYHWNTAVEEVVSHGQDKGFRVSAQVNGKPMTWEVDKVIGNVGYLADTWLTLELHTDYREGLVKQPEPRYFVLGMKSFGRDSSFLIKKGLEQVQELDKLIGKNK